MSLESMLAKALKSKDYANLEDVYHKIYDEYYKLVYFIIAKYVDIKEDIEDISDEVFLNFFNNVNKNQINNIKYYLTTSAKNMSINYLIKKREIIEFQDFYDYENTKRDFGFELINKMKEIISIDDLNIIVDHVLYGYSFKEIAQKRNDSINTISSRYRRSIKKVNQTLGDDYNG